MRALRWVVGRHCMRSADAAQDMSVGQHDPEEFVVRLLEVLGCDVEWRADEATGACEWRPRGCGWALRNLLPAGDVRLVGAVMHAGTRRAGHHVGYCCRGGEWVNDDGARVQWAGALTGGGTPAFFVYIE